MGQAQICSIPDQPTRQNVPFPAFCLQSACTSARIADTTTRVAYSTAILAEGNSSLQLPASEDEVVSLYPNPAQESVTVMIWQPVPHLIRIMNASGQVIREEATLSMENTLDIADLPKGSYVLEIAGKQRKYTKRLIVQ